MLTLTYIGIAVGSVITTATIVVLIWGLLKGLRRVLHIKPAKHYEAYIAPDPVVEAEEPTGGHSSFSKGNPMDWNDENNYEGTGRSKYMELSLRGGVPFPNAMR